MNVHKNPYISRVQIRNFRNFLNADVHLEHKQVVIGENNVGKTNFLRAIQLVLDKDFSDNDKQLVETDFHESIIDPMKNGYEIEIILNVRGYEHNNKLVSQFDDAVVDAQNPTLEFRFLFSPNKDQFGNILSYKYETFKGRGDVKFTSVDRSFINVYVIKALRDVERELKANKNSPLYKLVKKYEIEKEQLEEIANELKDAADKILELDEISHIKKTVQERFSSLSGLQGGNEITLRTFDVDMDRLLYSIQIYMGLEPRPVSELSLGLGNILYISLMLILLKDRTILPILKKEKYDALSEEDIVLGILPACYDETKQGNYLIKDDLSKELLDGLYGFMDDYNPGNQQSFTILAVEEPESHLHPILQRLIYREVLHKSNTSVIFTSHSTFITAVAPLSTIVHIRKIQGSSNIFSTAELNISKAERRDIERYLDAKRGEIYFGKAVILTEGITEDYFVPAASELLGENLDNLGIIVCNIHSTNFAPYIQILNALHIPWILFTDGDYYEIEETIDTGTGKPKKEKVFHILDTETGRDFSYRGHELIKKILIDLDILKASEIPDDFGDQDAVFNENGCFVGQYTLEVDMMDQCKTSELDLLKMIYKDLIQGGPSMYKNFETLIDEGDYWTSLARIENNISKGRFSQRLSRSLTSSMVPGYMKNGLKFIIQKVKDEYE